MGEDTDLSDTGSLGNFMKSEKVFFYSLILYGFIVVFLPSLISEALGFKLEIVRSLIALIAGIPVVFIILYTFIKHG